MRSSMSLRLHGSDADSSGLGRSDWNEDSGTVGTIWTHWDFTYCQLEERNVSIRGTGPELERIQSSLQDDPCKTLLKLLRLQVMCGITGRTTVRCSRSRLKKEPRILQIILPFLAVSWQDLPVGS